MQKYSEKESEAIYEETGEGEIEILGTNQEGIDRALETIHSICFVPKVDEVYKGVVKSIMPYGAFVGIGKNTDGLLHISEISWERLEKVESVLKEGDEIEVKLIEIDKRSGKLRLSRKVLLEKPTKTE